MTLDQLLDTAADALYDLRHDYDLDEGSDIILKSAFNIIQQIPLSTRRKDDE